MNSGLEKKKRAILHVKLLCTLRLIYSLVMGVVVVLGVSVAVLFCAGLRPYAVISGSMEPNIKVGSVCMVDVKVPFSQIKEGDVISVNMGDMRVTHRVYKLTRDGAITKGDANKDVDNFTVTSDQYFGKTVFSLPFLGYGVIFLKSGAGLVFGIGFIVLALVLDFLLDLAIDITRGELGLDKKSKQTSDGDTDEEEKN